MIDAISGAIYVIGGEYGYGGGSDVWASTDGGARAGREGVVGGSAGVPQGYLGVTGG